MGFEGSAKAEHTAAAVAKHGLTAAANLLLLLGGQRHLAALAEATKYLCHGGAAFGFAKNFVFLYVYGLEGRCQRLSLGRQRLSFGGQTGDRLRQLGTAALPTGVQVGQLFFK